MDTVGNEPDPQRIRFMKRTLDDVVMAMHLQRASIAEMGEHAKPRGDCFLQLFVAWIAMTGRNDDAILA